MGDIEAYISEARQKQLSDAEIKSSLLSVGWSKNYIDQALLSNNSLLPPLPPFIQEHKDTHYSIWDSVEHILLFVSMFLLAITIFLICNMLINIRFPSIFPSGNITDISLRNELMRVYLASLLGSFPVFSILFLHINRKTEHNPSLVQLPARKRLSLITLIITFLIVISDLILWIYLFLSGNITINTIFQLTIAIIIFGVIFLYYYSHVVEEDRRNHA